MFSDLKEALIEFLSNNAIWICIVIVIAILIVIALITWQIVINYRKKPLKHDDFDIFKCFGGKENIKNITIKGSRINLYLYNDDDLDKDNLKSIGISSIIKMSDHYVLVASNAEQLYKKLH